MCSGGSFFLDVGKGRVTACAVGRGEKSLDPGAPSDNLTPLVAAVSAALGGVRSPRWCCSCLPPIPLLHPTHPHLQHSHPPCSYPDSFRTHSFLHLKLSGRISKLKPSSAVSVTAGRLASLVVNPPPYNQEVEGSILLVRILFNEIGYPV